MRIHLSWRWMLPILFLSTYLASSMLNYDAIWFDEWITLYISSTGTFEVNNTGDSICEPLGNQLNTPLHTICNAAIDKSWPPLYFLTQELWDFITGGSGDLACPYPCVQARSFMDRSLAMFLGLIGLTLVYRLGKRLFNERIGLASALLLGTSIFFTFYMHEIRGYTLYVLFPPLNAWLYWRLLHQVRAGKGLRWGFALSIAGTLYTHYIGIAVVFGIGLYHLFFARSQQKNRVHWTNILKLYMNGCLAYSLWLAMLYFAFISEVANPRDIPTLELLNGMMRGFTNNLTLLVLPLLAISLLRWKDVPIKFLWLWGLSILIVAMIGNLLADFLFHPRHIIGLMPAFMILLAFGLDTLANRIHPSVWIVLLLWLGLGIFYGQTTDFMNGIQQHVDAVPLSAMNSILESAENCGTEDTSFVMAINSPEEEWVQDLPLRYYLDNYEMKFVSLSRIMSDEWVALQSGILLPDSLNEAGTEARYRYFSEGQNAIFLFSLAHANLENEISDFQNLLAEDGFVACPSLFARDDLVGTIYLRDSAQCETILSACRAGQ